MDLAKRKSLMKAFIASKFKYCPLIWMFHRRQLNNGINKTHERDLRLVYKDDKLTFNDLSEIDNSVTIHQRNLQILATEIFKVKNSLAKETHYNFLSEAIHFKRENVKSVHYGIQSVQHLRSKICNIVPQNVRESNSLNKFKSLNKFWKPNTCPCRLCKNYIAQVGFI